MVRNIEELLFNYFVHHHTEYILDYVMSFGSCKKKWDGGVHCEDVRMMQQLSVLFLSGLLC